MRGSARYRYDRMPAGVSGHGQAATGISHHIICVSEALKVVAIQQF